MATLADHEEDISSLEREIAALDARRHTLLREVEALEQHPIDHPPNASITSPRATITSPKASITSPRATMTPPVMIHRDNSAEIPDGSSQASPTAKELRDQLLFKRQFDNIVVPPPAHHVHFPGVLEGIFKRQRCSPEPHTEGGDARDEAEGAAEALEPRQPSPIDAGDRLAIVEENIYRMGGTTLFPLTAELVQLYFPQPGSRQSGLTLGDDGELPELVSDTNEPHSEQASERNGEHSEPASQGDDSPNLNLGIDFPLAPHSLIGLRLDTTTAVPTAPATFLPPHYIILKQGEPVKGSDLSRWEVFKHTIPHYIPLASISQRWLNTDLPMFAQTVRRALSNHQYKRDLFDPDVGVLGTLTHDGLPLFQRVECDLACTRVALVMANATINLECDSTGVVRCEVERDGLDTNVIMGNVKVIRLLSGKFEGDLAKTQERFAQAVQAMEEVV